MKLLTFCKKYNDVTVGMGSEIFDFEGCFLMMMSVFRVRCEGVFDGSLMNFL